MQYRLLFIMLWIFLTGFGQQPFHLRLVSETWEGFPGLQSFAAGQYQGKWVLIGGRTDGLHMKQPFASFHPDFNNTEIFVVDSRTRKVSKALVRQLPAPLAEQLQSTNMEFVQRGDKLYLFGGYGYSATQQKFITYPQLTIVHLPQLITAIEKQGNIAGSFSFLTDPRFAVTGGGAAYMNGKFYLAGGQKFTGRYNPHGPDHGPGFTQEYTNEVRIFSLQESKDTIIITYYNALHNAEELHRRDYNLVPQVLPDGSLGFTMFSGVFQYKADIPWLHPVDITENSIVPQPLFQQRYSHYHSAHLPLYSQKQMAMHTLFFGGIAQFYRSGNETREDKEVPFVNTISQVSRLAGGAWLEQALPVQMPGLMGASAWFAVNEQLPLLHGSIIQWDALPSGEHLAGYVVGGIHSSAPNIFWPNTGKQSTASPAVIAVYMRK